MYFLYDPVADENSGTSGGRKGPASFVIFDTNARKFVKEIPLAELRENQEGVVKFCWLIDDLPSGNASICVVTEQSQYSQTKLMLWSCRLAADGLNLSMAPQPLLQGGPIPVGEDYIVNNREDIAEVVLLTGPGMTVWRIDARNPQAAPVDSFAVGGMNMADFYDAFIWRGIVYLLTARHDESFDFSRLSVLDLQARGANMRMQPLQGDPMRGYPPARKQAGLALYMGRIYLTGGEMEQPNGEFFRLQDVWGLDTGSFTWQQYQCTIPIPLIEPRLTDATGGGCALMLRVTRAGKLYVWGDCDLDSGCIAPPTHSHIIRMSGCAQDAPPSYQQANAPPPAYNNVSASAPPYTQPATQAGYQQSQPAYPQPQPTYPQPQPPMAAQPQYPSPQQGYGQQQQSSYDPPPPQKGYPVQSYAPQQNQPTQPQYQQQGGSQPQYQQQGGSKPQYQQQQAQYPQGTHAVYPQAQQKKKDCALM